jgi:hypothetical protein
MRTDARAAAVRIVGLALSCGGVATVVSPVIASRTTPESAAADLSLNADERPVSIFNRSGRRA